MDEYRMARRVLMEEVSGGRVRGRPRIGWMDGVKVALGNRGMTVEAVRQCAKDRKEWRTLHGTYVTERVPRGHFCLALLFRTALPFTGGYYLDRSWMPLHDAVGIN